MSPEQIDACRNRNGQLKHDIAAQQGIDINRVSAASHDIDNLLVDLETMTKRAQDEQRWRFEREKDLAEEKKTTAELRARNRDLVGAVGPLRDKLSKARAIFKAIDRNTFSHEQKEDLKDIMRE